MILSAYEKRGYAKLFSNQDQIRGFLHTPIQTLTASRGVTPQRTGESITIMQPQTEVNEERLFRMAKRSIGRGVKWGLRRVLPRLAPIIGWGILAKDIYDIVTH